MHPKELVIKDFNYKLPRYHIAKYPLDKRDQSKLLVYQYGKITDHKFNQLPRLLPKDVHLVFNNTRVVQARMHFTSDRGKLIEIFCLEPAGREADITLALAEKGTVDWKCMVGGNRKWKSGVMHKEIAVGDEKVQVKVERKENLGGTFLIRFSWEPAQYSFAEILDYAGVTPLPPYLNRAVETEDKNRYQTVYAQLEGSVAAPTAGLHFTEEVLNRLRERSISMSEVTLHVGAGTFKPVSTELLKDHEMHYEYIDVDLKMIQHLAGNLGQPIVPVGTTSMRTVESLYWMGVKVMEAGKPLTCAELELTQWYPYDLTIEKPAKSEALEALIDNLQSQGLNRLLTRTQLMIAPLYQPMIANGMITNFHQPKSTLLVMVAALVGEDWKSIYAHARDNEYRFLSYGDANLLWF